MEFQTTSFAIFLIIILTWRNMKIASLRGQKYRPYGLEMYKGGNPFKELAVILKKRHAEKSDKQKEKR